MECPCCGAELEYHEYYYRGIAGTESFEKLGDIFKCPNFEGFEDQEEAKAYVESNNIEIGEEKDFETLEEVTCESATHGGFFYEDPSGDLQEGYPC
ncbi:hypothetical protein [Bacillus thuringiensis]|uniref:hypothetical protein n=1 Tax=Bacillus thuringiensis TaxID=1428 RepID=UPI000BFCE565|nr:hypothetical protein [Bacillus thuringiensis]PGT89906.1 hypothetical protein COD17_09145 [Bacillus thuringiensis]